MPITLTQQDLSLAEVISVARDFDTVELSSEIRDKLAATRQFIEQNWMHDEAPLIYSFNTGVGLFKDRRIALSDIPRFQTNLILSHATGVGEPLSIEAARAVMLLRLNAFKSDHSGVSLAVVDRLIDFLNLQLTPVIPVKGSVGASGDLAPLAHMSGALCGFDEAEIFYQGQRMAAAQALSKAGLSPQLELNSKDASALINGSTVSLALATLSLIDAQQVAKHADIGLALSLEAMRCEKDAFLPALHNARPHPGQKLVARNMMRLIGDSKRMSLEARQIRFPEEARTEGEKPPPRVQDVYSLRCAPQVHGPVRDALTYVSQIIECEMNSATDNPLIVVDEDERRAVSGGHFHGQYVAQATDLLTMVMADLGSISERRIARLIDPGMSYGLPRNLSAGKPGLHTGYATVQCSMSALVMENRTLSMPGSVDSIPSKGNAEDHVSNSMWCAEKSRRVVQNVQSIVATEILLAAQGLSLVDELAHEHPIATATQSAVTQIRQEIPARLDGDFWFATDMEAIVSMLRRGLLVEACETVVDQFE
jgi:histidine ammonia-lyase